MSHLVGVCVQVTSRPRGDRVVAVAGALRVLPTQALQRQVGGLGLGADEFGVAVAVGLAEGVSTDDQRCGLDVVHRHPAEGVADVDGRGQRIRVAVGAFGVDVDQAHLDRGQRVLQIALTGVALVVEPFLLGTPVDVLLRLPPVLATERETGGAEAHVLQGDVAGVDQQVGPGQVLAVLLLDRPQQAAGLVQVDVVRPAVQRGEALHAGARAAAAVLHAVGARGVPAHPDEERAVVPEVGGPPVLRGTHDLDDVGAQRVDIEGLHGLAVVEARVSGLMTSGFFCRIFRLSWLGHQSRLLPPATGGLTLPKPAGQPPSV